MECYLSFSVKGEPEIEGKVRALIETFGRYNKDESKNIAKTISPLLEEKIESLYENYGDILEGLEPRGKKQLIVQGMGASNTEEFMNDFMLALGPHVRSLSGKYTHDDEDGHDPVSFKYTKNMVI